MKKILLIAFKFPPFAGVGGFRWSELSRNLARIGYEIHVVTVSWHSMGPNALSEVLNTPGIKIHKIPSCYPHNMQYRKYKNRYLNFLKNRLFGFLFKYILRYFYFDDEAQQWGRVLIPYCERVLNKENIPLVIATGHPFQANRWAAELRVRNPEIKVIQDYRDPWADDPLFPQDFLNEKKIRQRSEWQKFSVENSDLVVAVTKGLLDLYLSCTSQKKKGVVIQNGYSSDIFKNEYSRKIPKDCILITYTGNIANERDKPLYKILDSLDQISNSVGKKVVMQLIGNISTKILAKYPALTEKEQLLIKPAMSQKEALRHVAESTFALHLNAEAYPYLVSTKIYEYAAVLVPVISINYGGEIDNLIKKNSLGYSLDLNTVDLNDELLKIFKRKGHKYSYKISEFDYRVLAKKYDAWIKKILAN